MVGGNKIFRSGIRSIFIPGLWSLLGIFIEEEKRNIYNGLTIPTNSLLFLYYQMIKGKI